MNSSFAQANQFYRRGDLHSALECYKNCKYTRTKYPDPICSYIDNQLKRIYYRLWPTNNPNIITTSCNSKFFNSLLLFLETILHWNSNYIESIYILNFGLDPWQCEVLQSISNVEVFTWNQSSLDTYPPYRRFNIEDPSTYFFKVFAFHETRSIISSKYHNTDINLLWLDVGNYFQFPLAEVLHIIEKEDYFFIDHSDVDIYYNNPQNKLVNILSPCLFQSEDIKLELPNRQQLEVPYIKANFFGTKISASTNVLLNLHRDICCKTDILFQPRDIKGFENQHIWRKQFDLPREGYLYLNGRHEQTVWTYLAAINGLRVRTSAQYSFTTAAGSGSMKLDEYQKRLRPRLDLNFDEMKDSMNHFIKQNSDNFDNSKASDNKNELISRYLTVSYDVYYKHKLFQGVGFPPPQDAFKSIALLHRGSMAKHDQFKYSGRLLNHFKNLKNEIFILLGNGPSLADVDFANLAEHHTFGLNAAYRGYARIGYWPRYFGCFDALVCSHHASKFKELIEDSPIEKFFFINIDDQGNQIFSDKELLNKNRFEDIRFSYRTTEEKLRSDLLSISFKKFLDMRTSGANTIQAALLKGYRKFILLGVDQNYTEVVDGAVKDQGKYHKLVMEKTPASNPNYWFSDYQQKGDKFNRPNLTISQIPAWHNLSATLEDLSISCMIYNCSPISQLRAFEKFSLDEAIGVLSDIDVSSINPFRSPLNEADRVFLV